jgi:hypothetical protein
MSSWDGFEDGEDSSDRLLTPSPPSSPFSTAFRTPRPPGIQTGVRDVPPELQTKHGILQSRYGHQNLNRIDPCTVEQDAKELGNNRRKITLRYAARACHNGSSKMKKIYCDCLGECSSGRCVCRKNGVIYCHKRSGECPNKAVGSAYTMVAVVEQEGEDEIEE